jgi:hypothetical protein
MFCEELEDKRVDLSVRFPNGGQPKKYARPIPFSEALANGQRKKVPLYDTDGATDIYDREKHLVGKEIFKFLYDDEKYNLVVEADGDNPGVYKTNTFSDFKLEVYANEGGQRISAWIPFIPNFGAKTYENKNYFFSDEFWSLSSDTYYHAASFLGSLLGPNEKINFGNGFIKRVPKFVYLAYCAYVYGFVNGKQDEYYRILNRVADGLVNQQAIMLISQTKSENELIGLSNYFKNWVESEFKSIIQSLETEKKSENKIHAKITRGRKGIFKSLAALEGTEVRLFDPDGEFMRKLMDFYWKKSTPIYIKSHGWKTGTPNGGYAGSGPSLEPYSIGQFAASAFFNKLYSRINGLKSNSAAAEPNEDDPSYLPGGEINVDFSKASTSQRNSLYYTLKNLYDRWISTYTINQFKLNSPEKEEADKRSRFVGMDDANGMSEHGVESEFNSFLYVDKFYNDISKKFIFNPTKFGSLLEMELDLSTNHSVISFISEFCKNNKLLFRCLPVRNSLYNLETITDMFTPMSPYSGKNRMGLGVGNTYLIMYTYEPSHKLALINDQKEGVGYKNDSFDIADITGEITDVAKKLLNGSYDPDELRLNVCAFGVTPNSQNQSYFTKVSVGMDNPRVTEQSIKNTIELANLGRKGGVSTGNGAGQDIYSIYSNRSYDCRVDMMGCMNIMPMMYFQLNNLPMFRGAYMITSVEHNIQNNTMTTSFVGQRQSKYLIPLDADIFNVAGLSEIVSNGVKSYEKINVPYIANQHGMGEYGTFDGNNIIYPAQGSKSNFDRTFYIASAVEQMGYKYPNEKGAPAPYGNRKSYHICATAVKAFIWAGFNGYADNTMTSKIFSAGYNIGKIGNGYNTYKKLQEIGFRVIATNSDLLSGFQPDPGDIGIMDYGKYGHICMWNGTNWVSDFQQNNLWVYGDNIRPKNNDKAVLVFRYWGPKDYYEKKKYGN